MLATALVAPMFAQGQTPEVKATVDYSAWLPAAGDAFFGISLDPFANFMGKMIQAKDQGIVQQTNPVLSLMGGYMITDQLAFRGTIGAIVDYQRDLVNVDDDAAKFANPYSNAQVQDEIKVGQYGASVSAGVEYRIGKGRVQGVFGGGLVYAFQTNTAAYKYGNAITALNQRPTVSNEALYNDNIQPGVFSSMRVINTNVRAGNGKNALFQRVGLYTTAGVECFLAPKIALGFNVNFDLLYKFGQDYCNVYEGYNTWTGKVEQFTNTKGATSFSGVTLGAENIGANLYMHFYL